jgi:hypothetical protein
MRAGAIAGEGLGTTGNGSSDGSDADGGEDKAVDKETRVAWPGVRVGTEGEIRLSPAACTVTDDGGSRRA